MQVSRTDDSNTVLASNANDITVDTVALTPTIDAIAQNVIDPSSFDTSANMTITGTMEAGSTSVTVVFDDGNSATTDATASLDATNGTWSATFTQTAIDTMSDGDAVTITATGIDIAGNTASGPSTVTLAMAGLTLALEDDTGVSADNITSNGIINVSGMEDGVTYQYLTNEGGDWATMTSATFTLAGDTSDATGVTYASGTVQVRRSDATGTTLVPTNPPSSWTTPL